MPSKYLWHAMTEKKGVSMMALVDYSSGGGGGGWYCYGRRFWLQLRRWWGMQLVLAKESAKQRSDYRTDTC